MSDLLLEKEVIMEDEPAKLRIENEELRNEVKELKTRISLLAGNIAELLEALGCADMLTKIITDESKA